MPNGVDIRGGRPGRFPRRGFPGRRGPIRRFPRFFFYPIGAPQRRCDYIDRYGRCCDRYGRCYNYGYGDGYPLLHQNDSTQGWSDTPDGWDMLDD